MPGPLTLVDLEALWHSVTDPTYSRSIREAPEGYEAIEQSMLQFERVSLAADRSSQELYLLPHSGQTAPPAGGAAKARCDVTITRTTQFTFAVVLDPRVCRVEEVATDFGDTGPVEIRTGRRYELTNRIVFTPGEAGPFTAATEAERFGAGFNNPAGRFTGADGTAYPGALRAFHEPGAGLANEGASIEPGATSHRLRAGPLADVPVPEHVGQQVQLQAGANMLQLRRVVGYLAPEGDDGGSLLLAPTAILAVSSVVGSFAVGEVVTMASGASGTLLRLANGRAVIDGTSLTEFGTGTLTGAGSGATATVDIVEQGAQMTAETGTATWRVVPLGELGLTASNPLSPAGGRDAVLDMLGDERRSPRAPGEDDDTYRRRIAVPADKITPLAVIRAANRALSDYGVEVVFRETGTEAYPGIRYDGDDSYDRDFVAITGVASGTFLDGERLGQGGAGVALAFGRAQVRSPVPAGVLPQPLPAPVLLGVAGIGRTPFAPGATIAGLTSSATVAAPLLSGGLRLEDVYRVQLDYTEFRAFFFLEAGVEGLGEFGLAYDAGPSNAYDAAPWYSFADGFPLTSAVARRSLWQAVDNVRAAGVGFDLLLP
jgi:hypothetical protein